MPMNGEEGEKPQRRRRKSLLRKWRRSQTPRSERQWIAENKERRRSKEEKATTKERRSVNDNEQWLVRTSHLLLFIEKRWRAFELSHLACWVSQQKCWVPKATPTNKWEAKIVALLLYGQMRRNLCVVHETTCAVISKKMRIVWTWRNDNQVQPNKFNVRQLMYRDQPQVNDQPPVSWKLPNYSSTSFWSKFIVNF